MRNAIFLSACLALLIGSAGLGGAASAQPIDPAPQVDEQAQEDPRFQELMRDLEAFEKTLSRLGGGAGPKQTLENSAKATEVALTVLLFAESGRWTARYVDRGVQAPIGALWLPQGARVDVQATAADLIYEMSFPGLGLEFTALPGRIGLVPVETDRAGVFAGDCAVCGAEGASLRIHIAPIGEFEAWIAERAKTQAGEN